MHYQGQAAMGSNSTNSKSNYFLLRYGGNNLFVPANKEEEVFFLAFPFSHSGFQVVLLLLLAEAMASKHVPLNQTPEYDTHR